MKSAKYAYFMTSYIFQPIVVQNLDPINSSHQHCLFSITLDKKFVQFLATTEALFLF